MVEVVIYVVDQVLLLLHVVCLKSRQVAQHCLGKGVVVSNQSR